MGNTSTRIKGYRVSTRLGGGCFGVVYKMKSKTDAKVYALKEIYRGKSPNGLDSLHREVNIHEQLPYHRNIVRFIECFKQEFKLYIVLEFCSLGTLNDYIITNDVSDKTLLYIMFDIARGLQHIHRHNIVHRDIKPDNVLLSAGKFGIPTCKICDFGLARYCDKGGVIGQQCDDDPPASDDGPMMYMAPEVTCGFYTLACDVFSLGMLYFVMYSRHVTEFKGRKVLEPHAHGYPMFTAPDSVVETEIDRYVRGQLNRDMIISMLKKTPSDRCTITAVLETLYAIFACAISADKDANTTCRVSNGHIE
ncbi:serine/threonine-protein kinase pdik1l-A-like [Haliotis rubra]|uniref:serine/threonine-protein kinase pdik1l-A-like n=1 Tax=Haliotis rubra TaxID=36100 RepID=UPI001EE56234|nr:serine/threonine-protein kinase pdik1l-A-like [Haliotis rubra]